MGETLVVSHKFKKIYYVFPRRRPVGLFIPIHIYKSIAAWYIYSRKFAKGCSKIKYSEPNWVLLRPLLEDGNIDAFVTNERLWGDIPKQYITFTRDLKTILMSQTYEKEIDLIGE